MRLALLALIFAANYTFAFQWTHFTSMNEVNSITEYNGSIYFSTNGCLAAVSKDDLTVTHFLYPEIETLAAAVTAAGPDSAGNLHVISYLSYRYAHSIFDGTSWSMQDSDIGRDDVVPVANSNGELYMLPKPACADQSGYIWSMNPNTRRPTYFDGTNTVGATYNLSYSSAPNRKIYTDHSGQVFFSSDTSIYLLNVNNTTWEEIYHFSRGIIVRSIASGPNSFFLGTNTGLLEINGSDETWHTVASNALPNDTVNILYTDKSGNLWGATDEGVFFYDGQEVTIIDLDYCGVPRNDRHGTAGIGRIICDSSSNVWFTTRETIGMFDGSIWREWKSDEANLIDGPSTAQLAATPDYIYVSQGSRIVRYNGTDWEVITDDLPFSLPQIRVHSIVGDGEGNIWISINNYGICKLDNSGTLTFIDPTQYVPEMPNTDILLQVGANNTVWIATKDNVFGKISADTVQQVLLDGSYSYYYCFAVDNEETYWISHGAEYGFRADWGTDSRLFSPDTPGVHMNPQEISIDRYGKKWMLTSMGLIYGAEKNNTIEEWTILTTENSEWNNLMHYMASAPDGTLWFGGRQGISKLQYENDSTGVNRLPKFSDYSHIPFTFHSNNSHLFIRVHPQKDNSAVQLRILDLLGRTVATYSTRPNSVISLERARFSPGMYITKLRDSKGRVFQRPFTNK